MRSPHLDSQLLPTAVVLFLSNHNTHMSITHYSLLISWLFPKYILGCIFNDNCQGFTKDTTCSVRYWVDCIIENGINWILSQSMAATE